eukprot:8248788-Pyramimonas_sp.AAC.1
MLRLAVPGASSSSSAATSGEREEMFPGQRMVERTPRAAMLDLGQIAGKCDTNQPLQADRRE